MKEQNAKIIGTMLGIEDHGILTWSLHLDYGGAGQSVGHYVMDSKGGSVPYVSYGATIRTILETVGVKKWEDLKGNLIRVKADYEKVYAIGHALDNKWMEFAEFYARFK